MVIKIVCLFIAFLCVSCSTISSYTIDSKNACYGIQLETLRSSDRYRNVQASFKTEFLRIKANSKSLLQEVVDDAVFFSSDSIKCVLLVLERSEINKKEGGNLFGSTRSYEGELIDNKWQFKKSFWYTFDNGYFEKYPENSFENISKVARYAVLSAGNVSFLGCEIDEVYWFE